MIRVLIAEDEPAAARYLKSLVESQGADFQVVALAGHGEEALLLAREHRPDLVFTDVRMPILDGIGLAGRLKNEFPGLPTVIVSGHQEFEYARKALALGVVDYLLKPVDPAGLTRLLIDLKGRIQSQGDAVVLEALTALLRGSVAEQALGLPARFLGALIRWGGPLTRPAPPLSSPGSTSELGFWSLPGRDAGEFLILADADSVLKDVFEARIRDLKPPAGVVTATLLFFERPVSAEELSASVRGLGPMLDRLLVPGRTRIHWGPVRVFPALTLDPVWTQQVRWALQESAYHKLESLVRGLVADWEREEKPARQATSLMRQALLLAHQYAPAQGLKDWDQLFDDALTKVDSYTDLSNLAWQLFSEVAGLGSQPCGSVDAPESHQRIRRYLQTNFAEPLSIPLICDQFQISQTSLSKLFRRYEGCTFHDYLTCLRLDAAERLLTESPDLPLKAVAAAVGYQDPFHFSRAFKAAKGKPPSQR